MRILVYKRRSECGVKEGFKSFIERYYCKMSFDPREIKSVIVRGGLGRASFYARSILSLLQVRPIGSRYDGELRPGTIDYDFKFQSHARGTKGHELKLE